MHAYALFSVLVVHSCLYCAGATVHQQHLNNGSVVLSFEAFLNAPHAGESGTLNVFTTDGSGPWSATKNITISSAGETNTTVQVRFLSGPLS